MPSPSFRIVPVRTAADLFAVAELFKAYAASLDVDLAFQGFEAELAELPGAYAPPCGELLLSASPRGLPLGCVALRPCRGCPDRAEAKRLYVSPPGRGSGLGRELVEAIIRVGRRLGYRELVLDTLPSMRPAGALYRSLGFRPVSPFYDTAAPGTIFLGLALHPGPA